MSNSTRVLRSRNANKTIVQELSSDEDSDLLDAKLSSLHIEYAKNASDAEKKRLLREARQESQSGIRQAAASSSRSNTAAITSPFKDSVFPSDSDDDELPRSDGVQTMKEAAEMLMRNEILNPEPKFEVYKFEASFMAKITTFEPYPDEDHLELERDYAEEPCISWQCDDPSPNKRLKHSQQIAKEMEQLALMGTKKRKGGIRPYSNEIDPSGQLGRMGVVIHSVKYSSIVDFNKAKQPPQQPRCWINQLLFGGTKTTVAPAPAQHSNVNQNRGQASLNRSVASFSENNERDDNFNMNSGSSKQGKGARRRKLARSSLPANANVYTATQSGTTLKLRIKVGGVVNSVKKSAEPRHHCTQCSRELTEVALTDIDHLKACYKDKKCPMCPAGKIKTFQKFGEHLVDCFRKNKASDETDAKDEDMSEEEVDLFEHAAGMKNGEKSGGSEIANSDSDQASLQCGPPMKKIRSSE